MSESVWFTALAALVHDIGKLYQRAHWEEKIPHTQWTHLFVQALSERQLLKTELTETLAHAASHHHQKKPPGWQPDNPPSWTVTLADNYASSERECEEDTTPPKSPDKTPLLPIFSRVKLGSKPPPTGLAYSLQPLKLEATFPNPAEKTALNYVLAKDRLEERLIELSNRLKTPNLPTLFANLHAFFMEVLWAVPSDTQCEPDISLYDHLRLSSAFAAALWRYHEETDGRVTIERLQKEDEPKFLIVQGDFGGIQNHIYRIREAATGVGSIAKRLRARSLHVALATEAFSHEILRALDLPPTNRFLSAGGRFTLLVQNTQRALENLERLRTEWQTWALEQGATLVPTLAWTPFSPAELKTIPFGAVLKEAAQALAEEKFHPFTYVKSLSPSWTQGAVSTVPCPVCDRRPANPGPGGTWLPCEECQAEEGVGRQLPRANAIWLSSNGGRKNAAEFSFPRLKAKLSPPGIFLYRSRFDFSPDTTPFEVRPLLGQVPTVKDALDLLGQDADGYAEWLKACGLEEELKELGIEENRPLTFSELAHLSEGAPYLGVLMLDADRMGQVFIDGLDPKLQSPSRLASLSQHFELFFGFITVELMKSPAHHLRKLGRSPAWIGNARRYRLIYSVYAGGDDVFLVAPWDVLIHYAQDLNDLYRQYTGAHPDLTLSGGILLAKPHTPVPILADLAQAAEKKAKSEGRNRLVLMGQAVRWDELPHLIKLGQELYRLLENKELPKAVAYRLLQLHQIYRQYEEDHDPRGMRYKPLLFYLRRNEDVERHWKHLFAPLMNHRSPEMRHLPVWVQYALYKARQGATNCKAAERKVV